MPDPRFPADEFFYSTLAGDATLMALGTPTALSAGTRVFPEDEVPQGTAYPLITYKHFGGPPTLRVVGTYRIWDEMVYVLKLIRDEAMGVVDARAIMARVDTLLDAASGSPTNGTVFFCVWDLAIPPYKETLPGGPAIFHHPVQYRLAARATA